VAPRVSPAHLKELLDGPDPDSRPILLDARLKYPFEHSTLVLPGARRHPPGSALPEDLTPGRAVVVYDSDPDEMVAERVAVALERRGVTVSVLAGGIAAWVAAKLPVDTKAAPRPSVPTRAG
jgi:rhodanese-related sulfurtransferase